MQSLHVAPESDVDQILALDFEAAYVVESAVVAAEIAGGCCDHWTVRTFVHVAYQEHCADIVAVVGKMAVPFEPADHSAQKTRCVAAQSQEVRNAYCSAVRAGASFEETEETEAEAAGEPLAAV